MGSELVSDSLPGGDKGGRSATPIPFNITYTQQFYEVFPFYLSIGMTADEFWNGDCCLTKYYRKAHEMKKDRKNEELWLQGLYFYEAMVDASPILNAFAKQGTKPFPYPKEPYARTVDEADKRKERDDRIRFEKMRADMLARVEKSKKEKEV